MSTPLISVIVPVWNDEKRIGLCLDALRDQGLARGSFELIVVDNGSTDGTATAVAAYDDVILLREPRPGSYAARNLGLSAAKGEYVAFTDSDCIPAGDWLETGLNAIRGREDVGVAAGRVMFLDPEGPHSRACLNFERHLSMRQDENVKKGHVITANWFSRKVLLDQNGGFNAALKSGGDYDLSSRIARTGLRTVYLEDAVVRHPARAQIEEITRKTIRVVGGKWASQKTSGKLWTRAKSETRNLIDRTRRIWAAKTISSVERLEVMMLIVRLWIVSLGELLRLQLGGSPARS